MTQRYRCLTLFCLLMLGVAGPGAAADDALRVMTFNVRVPADTDMNAWVHRREQLVRVIAAEHPDVLGTQELTGEQGEYIAAHLPGYAWFGKDRDGGTNGEHMGVFYRTDRLQVLRSGDFWLSDTPDVPGSKTLGPAVSTHGDLGAVSPARRGRHVRFFQYALPLPGPGCPRANAQR